MRQTGRWYSDGTALRLDHMATRPRMSPSRLAICEAPPSAAISSVTVMPAYHTSHDVTFVNPLVCSLRVVPDLAGCGTQPRVSTKERPSEIVIQAGRRLRAVREALSWPQERFADEIGVTRTALANWEGGTRLPDVLAMVRLFRRFGIPLEWIYAGELRHVEYDLAQALIDKAADLGAVVGAPTAEWPAAVTSRVGPHGAAPPARVPRRRQPKNGLHDQDEGFVRNRR
jgi:transcriptional regulator with XRE-family HTH domain